MARAEGTAIAAADGLVPTADITRTSREIAREPVFLLISAVNRDPEAWTRADKFDIARRGP
jgi:cytochrome P450